LARLPIERGRAAGGAPQSKGSSNSTAKLKS